MLTTLLTPLALITALFFSGVVFEGRTISMQGLTVPSGLTSQGYTSTVAQQRILSTTTELVRDAQTRTEAARIAMANRDGPVELLAGYLGVGPVLQAVQQSSGMLEYSVSGDIIQQGQELRLRLRVLRYDGRLEVASVAAPVNDVERLLQAGGFALLRMTDPHIACAAILRKSIRAGSPDLAGTLACVQDCLTNAGPEDRGWLYNLGGVVRTMAGDLAGATAYFRAALHDEPNFSPALLNLGILMARNGQDADAVQAFEQIFRRQLRSDSLQTYAAALTMWARSLERLGQPDAATDRLRQAVRIDPQYRLARTLLLERLSPGPEAIALRTGAPERTGLQDVYTDNILGVMPLNQLTPG
jgi:tetratricopeptide (TPR) repeat protein